MRLLGKADISWNGVTVCTHGPRDSFRMHGHTLALQVAYIYIYIYSLVYDSMYAVYYVFNVKDKR